MSSPVNLSNSGGDDSNSGNNNGFLEEQEPEDQAQEQNPVPESSSIIDIMAHAAFFQSPFFRVEFNNLEEADNEFCQLEHRPASKTAIENLRTITVSEEVLNSKSDENCVVCLEEFMIGEELKELPCNHMYHKDCILTWLGHRNTCPLCKGELARDTQEAPQGNVDDDDRRRRRRERIGSG